MENFNTPHSESYRLRRGKLKCIEESNNTIDKLELMDYVEQNPTACEYILFSNTGDCLQKLTAYLIIKKNLSKVFFKHLRNVK